MPYWEQRQKQLNVQLEHDEARLQSKLTAYYSKESRKLEKEIAAFYRQYGEDNVIQYRNLMQSMNRDDQTLLIERMDEFAKKYPQYEHILPVRENIYKLNRLEGLQTSVKVQQLEIGAIENEQMREHLQRQASRSASAMAEELGFGKNFYTENSDIIKKLIKQKWANEKNFSDDIWKNRTKLADYLNQDFAAGVARGDSYERLASGLKKRFTNVSQRDIKRLIYTEGTFALNEGLITPFEKDFEEYEISIADSNACEECKALLGRKFKIKDRKPGVNFPPIHTWCRCSFTIVIAPDLIEKYDTKSKESGIIQSGAISGARNPDGDVAKEHAKRYYGLVRAMKTDVKKIAKTTGYSEREVQGVKDYIFLEKHDLGGDELEYFEPDYMMSESWQRLSDGKPEPHDITLIAHEIMEKELINKGMSQYEAHIKASKKYNYDKEAEGFYGKIKKYKKE